MTIIFRLATVQDIPSLEQLIPESVRALSAGYTIPPNRLRAPWCTSGAWTPN
jgi:hypothetical protein